MRTDAELQRDVMNELKWGLTGPQYLDMTALAEWTQLKTKELVAA